MRLDVFLSTSFGFTRNKSQQFIKSGLISIDKKIICKPAHEVFGDEEIHIKEDKQIHWVSRSAGKLDGFLLEWEKNTGENRIKNARCLDVGSSTGGFTQVLIDRGAKHIDAVDVGTNQLHESIKNNSRVTSYEQTDIREFARSFSLNSDIKVGLTIEEGLGKETGYNIIVCDASFISMREIFPSILKCSNSETNIIILWKPQFEVGREHLRKTGVPKDETIIQKKQKEWEEYILVLNCEILQKKKSLVMGEAGNQEWLYWIRNS